MNEQFKEQVRTIIGMIGLNEPSVDFDPENRRITVFANEGDWFKKHLPFVVSDLERLVNLVSKKHKIEETIFVDVNNYRKERENIIIEIAKASARKVQLTKAEVKLPAMNAYERRLVHTELATRPDVKSESSGEGRERHVVIKPI